MAFQKLKQSPTLNTILMVENTFTNMEESLISVSELKRKLPKQVNHNMLKVILDYLQESNKILISTRGMVWIHNINPNLAKAISEGRKI